MNFILPPYSLPSIMTPPNHHIPPPPHTHTHTLLISTPHHLTLRSFLNQSFNSHQLRAQGVRVSNRSLSSSASQVLTNKSTFPSASLAPWPYLVIARRSLSFSSSQDLTNKSTFPSLSNLSKNLQQVEGVWRSKEALAVTMARFPQTFRASECTDSCH
jgi:hypothetical protein